MVLNVPWAVLLNPVGLPMPAHLLACSLLSSRQSSSHSTLRASVSPEVPANPPNTKLPTYLGNPPTHLLGAHRHLLRAPTYLQQIDGQVQRLVHRASLLPTLPR